MELNLNSSQDIKLISSYDEKSFTINDERITSSFLISANSLRGWDISNIEQINNSLTEIIASTPEIVIIGTGKKATMLKPHLLEELINKKISYEIMSSIAAAKTYNVLAMDNRNVLAAIFI